MNRKLLLLLAVLVAFESVAQAPAQPKVSLSNDLHGVWSDPAVSGQGFVFEFNVAANLLALGWFTWSDTAGEYLWYSGVGTYSAANPRVEVMLNRTRGGRFNNPTAVATSAAGTAVINFESCTTARFAFNLTDPVKSGTINLTKLLPVGTGCIDAAPALIRLGLWEGTLPSAPRGSGTLSFRVSSPTSMTILSTKVPTFSNMSGCSSTWNNVVTIGSNRTFSTTLTAGNTSLSIAGTFDSDIAATGTILGVCNGGLVFLGQTFRANWVSTE